MKCQIFSFSSICNKSNYRIIYKQEIDMLELAHNNVSALMYVQVSSSAISLHSAYYTYNREMLKFEKAHRHA